MVSPKRVTGEILLAEGTSQDARVVLPADNGLFEGFSLIILPRDGPELVCAGLNLLRWQARQ